MNNPLIKFILHAWTNICRLLIAGVFIFSGFVKAIDPHGTEYKIHDYLQAFGLMEYVPDSMPIVASVALSAFEFLLGIFLLFGIRRRLVSSLTSIFLLFMTGLTLYLAIKNPVSDCGCFGDALVLTNWQTFWKNVVLFFMAVLVLGRPSSVFRLISEKTQWIISLYSFLFILGVSFYCLRHLPLLDFRPYHIGADIVEQMTIPNDAKSPVFETTLIYSKGGKQQEFTLQNYPKDGSWTFVKSESKMVEEGYVPPIHDFSLTRLEDGEDVTDEILHDSTYTFLLVAPHLELASESSIDLVNELYDYCLDNGYKFFCLTSSTGDAVERWKDYTGAEYPFLNADDVTLKTMVRSNPGLILLRSGVVINKWSDVDLPDEYEMVSPSLDKLEIAKISQLSVADKLMFVTLWYVLPLLLLTFFDRLWAGVVTLKKRDRLFNLLKTKKMRKKIVAGNWKMNKNLQEGVALAKELNEVLSADKPNCGVVICTPFIHLASVAAVLDENIIGLGAENCADKASGAYTGEVSAEMVKSTGAQYVILGHSERRQYYNETPEILKEKVNLALANGLKVIFCIGETLEEREANKQNEVCKAELSSVFDLSAEEFANVVIAYEPIWAIGTGKTATAEQAEEIHAYIRSVVAEKFGAQVADDTTILYGGSCKASNAPELFAKPNIDGGLIGGASLKAADFKGIIDAWKK